MVSLPGVMRNGAFAFAPGLQRDLVAILEEGPGFPRRQFHRALAALANFQQRPEATIALRRQRACADQIPWLQIAPVRAVVRDNLRSAPVHGRVGRPPRQDVRRSAFGPHPFGG